MGRSLRRAEPGQPCTRTQTGELCLAKCACAGRSWRATDLKEAQPLPALPKCAAAAIHQDWLRCPAWACRAYSSHALRHFWLDWAGLNMYRPLSHERSSALQECPFQRMLFHRSKPLFASLQFSPRVCVSVILAGVALCWRRHLVVFGGSRPSNGVRAINCVSIKGGAL